MTVTTVVRRTVRPDRHDHYEAWLRRLLERAEGLDGYLGADVQRPSPGPGPDVWTSVFRFDTLEHRDAFLASDLHRDAQREVAPLVEADAAWETHTGLELWFSPPPGTVVPQPVRWRMAVLLTVVVYVLVLAFGAVAAVLIPGWPTWLRLLVVIAVEVALMTYVLLPALTRRLARWIYPRATTV